MKEVVKEEEMLHRDYAFRIRLVMKRGPQEMCACWWVKHDAEFGKRVACFLFDFLDVQYIERSCVGACDGRVMSRILSMQYMREPSPGECFLRSRCFIDDSLRI